MNFPELLRSKGLTDKEIYKLIMMLSEGISKATRAGWVAYRDGYRPQDAYRHWACADDLSAVRWDALEVWSDGAR